MIARRRSYTLIVLSVLALALLLLRLQMPSMVKDYLNGKLANMGEFEGQIANVDIYLWRGAYSVDQLVIHKKGQPEIVFFEAETVDSSVSWRALLRGRIVANVRLVRAGIHRVAGSDDDGSRRPSEDHVTWRQTVQKILSIQIDTLALEDSRIHFHDLNTKPQVHLVFYEVNGEVTNLSNADRSGGIKDANFDLRGRLLDEATATMNGRLDPLGNFHDFQINLRITDIDLTKLNTVSQAYGNFDFKSGHGDFIMELTAEDAQLTGYAKPLLDNVEIFDLQEDLKEGVLNVVWHAIVGAFGQVFRNGPADRIATQIEIRGDLNQPDTSAWQAFLGIMRNAFVEAYQSNFEGEA